MSSSPPSISTSRIFAIPQLDEDVLRNNSGTNNNHSATAAATAATFAAASRPNTSATDKGRSGFTTHSTASVGSPGFTLIADGLVGFGPGANDNSPPSLSLGNVDHGSGGGGSGDDFTFLQQQQAAAAVTAAAAQLEQDFYFTQVLLQQSPRPVLLAVLSSLMEEYPTTLIAPIKARLEHFFNANAALKSSAMHSPMATASSAIPSPHASPSAGNRGGSSRYGSAASFVPNSSAAAWTPSSQHGGGGGGGGGGGSVANSFGHTHSPSHSRASASSRGKGKGAKEEQEMCSIHNSMRAMKHLHLNPDSGKLECIHGFHCLVDEPSPAKRDATAAGAGYTVVGGNASAERALQLEGSDDCIGGRSHNNSRAPSNALGTNNRFADPSAGNAYAAGLQGSDQGPSRRSSGNANTGGGGRPDAGSSPVDDELLAYTLKLLQSVRAIEEEE